MTRTVACDVRRSDPSSCHVGKVASNALRGLCGHTHLTEYTCCQPKRTATKRQQRFGLRTNTFEVRKAAGATGCAYA